MAIQNYGSNSYRSKEERHIDTKVPGLVEKTLAQKFKDSFKPQNLEGMGTNLVLNIVVPAIKETIMNLGTAALESWLGPYKKKPTQYGGYGYGTTVYSNYSAYYDRTGGMYSQQTVQNQPVKTGKPDYHTIVMNSKEAANRVLDLMVNCLEKYDSVSIKNLYEAIGARGDWTDDSWGWTDLSAARVVQVHNGWLIDLPNAVPLK